MDKRNEELLENTAITFNLEAISSGIKKLLNEKVSYNLKVFKEINQLIINTSNSKDKKLKSALYKDLVKGASGVMDDFQTIVTMYNKILLDMFLKEEETNQQELNKEDSQ